MTNGYMSPFIPLYVLHGRVVWIQYYKQPIYFQEYKNRYTYKLIMGTSWLSVRRLSYSDGNYWLIFKDPIEIRHKVLGKGTYSYSAPSRLMFYFRVAIHSRNF